MDRDVQTTQTWNTCFYDGEGAGRGARGGRTAEFKLVDMEMVLLTAEWATPQSGRGRYGHGRQKYLLYGMRRHASVNLGSQTRDKSRYEQVVLQSGGKGRVEHMAIQGKMI